jgi:NTE family protein
LQAQKETGMNFHWFDHKQERKDVALVLSTGGARGLAHIGAIDELLERGYNIRSVAGTSMGALVGGMYAAGRLEDFREWMLTVDRKRILSLLDFSIGQNHIVKGDRIIEAMKSVVPDVRIEDLEIPYCAVATDVVSGTEVVFDHGSLYEAIRASISLPLFFSPVRIDDKILVDGGLVNPLPLNRVKRDRHDLLVAVNVSGHDYRGQLELRKMIREQQSEKSRFMALVNKFLPDDNGMNYYTLLNRSTSIMINRNAQLQLKLTPPDVLVDIPMNRYDTFDFDKMERLAAIGRTKTKKALDKFIES